MFEQTNALIWAFLYHQSSHRQAEAVGLEDQGHQGLVEEACHWELLVEEIHSLQPLDKTFLYSILLHYRNFYFKHLSLDYFPLTPLQQNYIIKKIIIIKKMLGCLNPNLELNMVQPKR